MEWVMLNESKKLFPHWLDKNDDSNFSKHLSILNHQQLDKRHKLKTVEWSRLLNKPIQIHKVQSEPYKWKMEFEVNIPRLKTINIYKNPTVVNNEIINNMNVINGYYYNNNFYEIHNTEITDVNENVANNETFTFQENGIIMVDNYYNKIKKEDGKYYYDIGNKNYYKCENNSYISVDVDEVPKSSLIYSQSFIDNYSHFFRHIHYEDNTNSISMNKFILDSNNNKTYKTVLDGNYINNGKYELSLCDVEDEPKLFYNTTTEHYCVIEDNEFRELSDNKITYVTNIDDIIDIGEDIYYIFINVNEDNDRLFSRIPLIETEDITPIISDDRYVLEVYTWDDYHFLKGYPEIDFIDYNNNNIIDENERIYDNLNINIESINNKKYLTFRIHQYGIKLVEIFKDGKPIHIADFIIEKLGYNTKQLNTNFAHMPLESYNYNANEVNIYSPFIKDTDNIQEVNLELDEYVWRYELTDEDFNGNDGYELKNNYDLKVTYYDSSHRYDSEYDKVLTKRYVCEDSIFYHDISLDMLGVFYNVPRHVFRQPTFESHEEEIEYYSNTYPSYCNTLTEDDYHYQKRLEYYINHYNKTYFPVLEFWKYFHVQSELVNRKVIIAEQNYSYLRNLDYDENQYINELGKNKLESVYSSKEDYIEEKVINYRKPKTKSIISPEEYVSSRDGILVDDDLNYITDSHGTLVRVKYDYDVIVENGVTKYEIKYENAPIKIQWYTATNDDNDSEGEVNG